MTLIQLLIALAILIAAFVISIVIPAKMAANRNRSSFIWVMISLLGSALVAIILLAILGKNTE